MGKPDNFDRVITITEVPESYGRRDVAEIIQRNCGVTVRLRDIVFRFKRWGRQADVCYVLCRNRTDADHCIATIQELAVPKRAAYGSLFGAAFLWSSRSSLFVSHPTLDFALDGSKHWVFTTGWEETMDEEAFIAIMGQLRFFPEHVVRFPVEADRSCAFFMRFHNMQFAKKA